MDYLVNRFCNILEDYGISSIKTKNDNNIILTFKDLSENIFKLFKNLKLDKQFIIQEKSPNGKANLIPKDTNSNLEIFELIHDMEDNKPYLKLILKESDYTFKINKIHHALINNK